MCLGGHRAPHTLALSQFGLDPPRAIRAFCHMLPAAFVYLSNTSSLWPSGYVLAMVADVTAAPAAVLSAGMTQYEICRLVDGYVEVRMRRDASSASAAAVLCRWIGRMLKVITKAYLQVGIC